MRYRRPRLPLSKYRRALRRGFMWDVKPDDEIDYEEDPGPAYGSEKADGT